MRIPLPSNRLVPALALGLVGPLGGLAAAQQGWTVWPQNGRYYLPVYRAEGVTWLEARAEAQALGGDLVTIASAAENAFVFSLVSDPAYWRLVPNPTRVMGPWLGGRQLPATSNPNANWGWVSGEPWTYANWSPGEPNDWLVDETRLQFFNTGTTPAARWNDHTNAAVMFGFVAEAAVLPPATWASFGSGCGDGGATAALTPVAPGTPALGASSVLRFSDYPAGASIGAVVLGLSSLYEGSGAIPLPFSLDALGWTGCAQHVSVDAVTTYALTGLFTDHSVSIPSDLQLAGVAVHFQAIALQGPALVASNGVTAYVGH